MERNMGVWPHSAFWLRHQRATSLLPRELNPLEKLRVRLAFSGVKVLLAFAAGIILAPILYAPAFFPGWPGIVLLIVLGPGIALGIAAAVWRRK